MIFNNNSIKFLIITIFLIQLIKCDQFKTIEIENGLIRGKILQSVYLKSDYFAFRGIPYAKPPIGNLRFKLPEKPEPWTDVKDVIKIGSDCVQKSSVIPGMHVSGNEDCLFLNVYTPDLTFSEKLPVMFFIHGGGYQEMSSSDLFYGPDFFINENVIVVTINYRLGPLGFLSVDYLPQNVGLYDQLLALKWVNENIDKFGGDKNEITIFGESAGSSSIHFQILSPLTKNLFKRAILQSGTALDTWAYENENHNQNDIMVKFGKFSIYSGFA